MMRDPPSCQRSRTNLDGAQPSGFGQSDIRERPPPHILMLRLHRVGFGFDDEIRRTQILLTFPLIRLGKLFRRRHVLQIAERRSGIDPADDRADLVVGQRHVVLELLNADILVDMPRRHLALDHALTDRFRPRACLVVRYERHRRDRPLVMAFLASLLENRSDISGESHRIIRRLRRKRGCQDSEDRA